MKKKNINISILITAEQKENYISKTINSCLEQSYKKIEIIVVYTSLKNEKFLKKKFRNKKIIFLKIEKRLRNKTQDQFYKIFEAFKISKGKIITLLDGDDLYTKDKILTLSKQKRINNNFYLDNFIEVKNNKHKKIIEKKFKNSKLYQYIFNEWPKNIVTSAISGGRSVFNNFFNYVNFRDYKFLAIDALIILYAYEKKKLIKLNKYLTFKVYTDNSVDLNFIGLLNKYFWQRRLEQHNYFKNISKKNYFSIDYIICKFLNTFL